MSDEMSFSANTVSGQINQGKEFTASQNQGNTTTTTVDVSAFFDKLREALPENVSSELITPLASEAIRVPLHDAERSNGLLAKITPYGPAIQKALLAFGSGALESLASSNPIVRGTLKAVQALDN
jgi:hypothetical protein